MKTLLLAFIFIYSCSFGSDKPKQIAEEIVEHVQEATKGESGKFVLVAFVNGSMEIVAIIKPSQHWDEIYKKEIESKITFTIMRGANTFKLLLIQKSGELVQNKAADDLDWRYVRIETSARGLNNFA